jgi:hypothetical protein
MTGKNSKEVREKDMPMAIVLLTERAMLRECIVVSRSKPSSLRWIKKPKRSLEINFLRMVRFSI